MAVSVIIIWKSSSIIYKANERSEHNTGPKNTLSSRDRQATMCICMCAHTCMSTSQRTRSVIIYCPVNLDLPTEMNCPEQTRQRWNSRSFWNVWLALGEGVRACCRPLSPDAKGATQGTYIERGFVFVQVQKMLTSTHTHTDIHP